MHTTNKIIKPFLALTLISLLFVSCGEYEQRSTTPDIDDLLSFTATEVFSMSEVDSIYFSHLGYESVVLENGNILIPDRQLSNLIVIDDGGNLIKTVRDGRGPGEIQDAYEFTVDAQGNVYTYDQRNDKILVFDKDVALLKEVIPVNYESTSLAKAYPMKDDEWIFELNSFEFLRNEDKERELFLINYDLSAEGYGEKFTLNAQPYARLIIDGVTRGGRLVPFSGGTISTYNPEEKTLFLFDTSSDLIAEVNASYDTVNTIPVNLPTEELSQAERDSIRSDHMDEQWKTMQELLPEVKAPVSKMIYHKGEFWMESNILGDSEMWLVLNKEGQITRVVHLPKDSMLMHVSDEHLGVRLDDVTFALFTNPKPEAL
ncbi:6-bladed beta-propeller [Gracilimonas halophila]|uniref:6-bladed beta-propeller n=1 Tax=Gracilimonas halophila TaxID=1834464 RepID=A0ABW5JM76_9BACT